MHPTLFDSSWIGLDGALHFTLSSYFTAILLGFLLAARLTYRDVRALGMSHGQFVDFAIWMLIIGVLGSRVMHVLVDGFLLDYVRLCTDPFALEGRALPSGEPCAFNSQCLEAQGRGLDIGGICHPEDGQCYPQQDCFRWLKFWAGGLTVYGALIGCTAFAWFYIRRIGISGAKMLDIGGYAIPVGMAVGRLGCFLSGCCFGAVCAIEQLGVRFPAGSLAYRHHFENHHAELQAQWADGIRTSLPVYPTQLIESLYALGIFLVVYFVVRPRKRFDGQLIATTGLLYGICRFLVEFWRDDARGGMLALSTSQWVSVPIVVVCALVLWRGLRAPGPAPE